MLMDIFSIFDPMWFNLCYKNLMIMIFMLLQMTSMFWMAYNKLMTSYMLITSLIISQFMKTKLSLLKAMLIMGSAVFMFILYINMTSMLPYMFSTTSHIIFSSALGLPMWLLVIMSSYSASTSMSVAHLLPNSTPLWLSPFLILVETSSILIRPITLSFRLTANMSTGHIIMSLILLFSTNLKTSTLAMMMSLSMMYTAFELMICMIQAYIFCLLISLYTNDHM